LEPKRILVVDDDPDITEYVGTFLEDHDYEVMSAGTSEAAVRVLERFTADLVIVDVMMPGRSGLDLLVTLRRDPRWADLLVVMFTGNDRVLQDGGKSYLAMEKVREADAVMGKPLVTDELLATLERLLA
jgi:DNA-binding response OmpR family regulator